MPPLLAGRDVISIMDSKPPETDDSPKLHDPGYGAQQKPRLFNAKRHGPAVRGEEFFPV
jgi:hypothetical protein